MTDIFLNSIYLSNCNSRRNTNLNLNCATAGRCHSGFNSGFSLRVCKFSNVLIQKFSQKFLYGSFWLISVCYTFSQCKFYIFVKSLLNDDMRG